MEESFGVQRALRRNEIKKNRKRKLLRRAKSPASGHAAATVLCEIRRSVYRGNSPRTLVRHSKILPQVLHLLPDVLELLALGQFLPHALLDYLQVLATSLQQRRHLFAQHLQLFPHVTVGRATRARERDRNGDDETTQRERHPHIHSHLDHRWCTTQDWSFRNGRHLFYRTRQGKNACAPPGQVSRLLLLIIRTTCRMVFEDICVCLFRIPTTRLILHTGLKETKTNL